MTPRKKKNSAKVNLIFSLVFHSVLIGALFFFAAREGLLGKQLKTIAVTLAPKEKPPEKPKEKPPEPKAEPPKEEAPKVAAIPQPARIPPPTAAPASTAPPAVAPPAASLPSFNFSDGAKAVESSSNPVTIYKGFIEFALRSKWVRPDQVDDTGFVAEVELEISPAGAILASQLKKGSGDARWDDSVKKVLAQTKSLSRPPPKGFPGKFLVRFDTQTETEEIIQ